MKLRVQYSAQLRTAVGRSHDELDLPDGSSLAALLDHLAHNLDDSASMHLVAASGSIRPSLLIVINDIAVPIHTAADRKLKDGETVLLLPPIAGG